MARYGMHTTVKGSLDEVRAKVMDAISGQGFGILTEINVRRTLKEKLGADMEPYLILGACNARLAHQARSADRSIGLLLPCNLTLHPVRDAMEVSILDPEAMFSIADPESTAPARAFFGGAKKLLEAVLKMVEPA